MRSTRRYVSLLGAQLRASLLVGAQYRADFLLDGLLETFWALSAIVPLWVVFRSRASVAGWSFGEATLVTAWFTLLQALIEGAINPSLTAVVDHVRQGTFDFVLLKPADAQFLVSTARIQPWRATNVVTAALMFGLAFRSIGHPPAPEAVLVAALVFVAGAVILYSLWLLSVSVAFYVARVDNLAFLFSTVFDAARWPSSVFRGAVSFVITFVIPLAVMTTFPARALLGALGPRQAIGAGLGAFAFAFGARRIWLRAVANYTSAGG